DAAQRPGGDLDVVDRRRLVVGQAVDDLQGPGALQLLAVEGRERLGGLEGAGIGRDAGVQGAGADPVVEGRVGERLAGDAADGRQADPGPGRGDEEQVNLPEAVRRVSRVR